MSDENTNVYSSITGRLAFQLSQDGDKTYVLDAVTGRPVYVIDGDVGGAGVKTMTTEERMAIVPKMNALIYDSTDGSLYVGDGVTQGGVQASSVGTLPSILSIGDWTDEMEDVYDMGDWTR